MSARTPRQRWGTCCPDDPECEHSFMDGDALARWMDTPISDEIANELCESLLHDSEEVMPHVPTRTPAALVPPVSPDVAPASAGATRSARDDYPLVRALDALNGGPSALDEIDRLRKWKAEALLSLNDWHTLEQCIPAEFAHRRLGQPWPRVVREYIAYLGQVRP